MPAPPGWVVDADVFEDAVAAILPAGLSSREALASDGFIYTKFALKDKSIPDLVSLTAMQDDKILKNFPGAKIEYSQEKIRDDLVLLRTVEISETYIGPEYTIFIDFGKFIFFLVAILCDCQFIDTLEFQLFRQTNSFISAVFEY